MIFHKHLSGEFAASPALSATAAVCSRGATNLARLELSQISRTLWATYRTCSGVIAGYNGRETIRGYRSRAPGQAHLASGRPPKKPTNGIPMNLTLVPD